MFSKIGHRFGITFDVVMIFIGLVAIVATIEFSIVDCDPDFVVVLYRRRLFHP